jgi:heme/copper-type cytochrome/quinol oxidase subunit 2
MKDRDFMERGMIGVMASLLVLCVAAPAVAQEEPAEPESQETAEAEGAAGEEPVKFIKMYVEEWKWTPSEIRVKQGTRLKIEFLSYEASRRFDLKGYRIKVPLPQDKPVTFEFVADKKGVFKFRCGRPCGDGCAKLVGKLIVE